MTLKGFDEMKNLSIYSSLGKGTTEERLKAIKNAGFNTVCLDFEKNVAHIEGDWVSQISHAVRAGLLIENVHLTGEGMSDIWADCINGNAVTDRLIAEMRDLKGLGLDKGVCHVTWGLAKPHEPDETGLDRFKRIADAAERYGVYLALENSVFPEYLQFIFDNIKSEYIGFCFDSGHEHAFAKDFGYLDKFGDRLMALHLHDNDGIHDQHLVPFYGSIDWDAKVKQLKKTKLWETTVTLESCIYGEESLEDGLKRSYEAAKKLAEM